MYMDSTQTVLSIIKLTFMINKMRSSAWMSDKMAGDCQ